MARTSKTQIGGSGESNDRMMRAASSGAAAVQQAHSELLGQYRAGAQQANQTAQVTGQIVGAGEERNQQAEQFAQRMQHEESSLDLEGAKAGFERGGQEPGADTEGEPSGGKSQGQEPGGSEREKKLDAEMQKGAGQGTISPLDPQTQTRLNEQVGKKMEMDSGGKWRPTAERTHKLANEQRREDFQADTERIRAEAYRDQVGVQAQKALAEGNTEAYKEKAKMLAQTPNDMQKAYDRMMQGKVRSEDWSDMASIVKNDPNAEQSLLADIKSKTFTPRVQKFLRAQVQIDSLKSIVRSKGSTNYLEVDWTAPKMREFQNERDQMNDFMRANPAMSQVAFIQSTDDKMRFLNVMAAAKVLMGMSSAPSPAGGMTPATQGQGPAPAAPAQQGARVQHSTVPGREEGANAVRTARESGASVQEALEAGQAANPTAGQRPGAQMSYERARRSGL